MAADIGIKKAISNAKKTGIGLVGIKNSGHYGLSGYYAEKAVKKNLIAFIFTNATPAIAHHGALKSLFGTNPICFGTTTSSKIHIHAFSKCSSRWRASLFFKNFIVNQPDLLWNTHRFKDTFHIRYLDIYD